MTDNDKVTDADLDELAVDVSVGEGLTEDVSVSVEDGLLDDEGELDDVSETVILADVVKEEDDVIEREGVCEGRGTQRYRKSSTAIISAPEVAPT